MTEIDNTIQTTEQFEDGEIGKRVRQYIAIREKRREVKKKDVPLLAMENLLSSAIMKLLNDAGIESARTPHGTCFKTTKTHASLADPEAFMKHVIATGQFELLDKKVNTTAAKDYVAKNHELPPGVNLNMFATIGVHKKVGGGDEE